MTEVTVTNVAVVFTTADGKANMRKLSEWESTLVLAQLQELDGGALKATEIQPVLLIPVTHKRLKP